MSESGKGRRRLLLASVAAGLALLAFLVLRSRGGAAPAEGAEGRRGGAGGAGRPAPVVLAEARAADMPVYLRGLGTVLASKTATVRSRVEGQLVRVAFSEGQPVREGALLAELDPRPFQVVVAQAEGQLARDQAALEDARVNLRRSQELFEQQILPRQQLDTQASQVGQLEGAIKADLAKVEDARLQLAYARITAPFSGRAGLRQVDPGNVVRATDPNGLLVLTQVHPIVVLFSLPQDVLGDVLTRYKSGATLPVDAFDRDNTRTLATGRLESIDNQIDAATGTYKLKAVFANEDDALFPNQFVNVRLHLDTRRGLALIPSVAVQRGAKGTFVYAVDADQTAHMRPVTIAISEGQDAGISEGLKPGETVVVDGQDKVKDGGKVEVARRGEGEGARSGAAGKGDGASGSGSKRGPRRQP
jgi:multidrug efflux system membrane fusion protein